MLTYLFSRAHRAVFRNLLQSVRLKNSGSFQGGGPCEVFLKGASMWHVLHEIFTKENVSALFLCLGRPLKDVRRHLLPLLVVLKEVPSQRRMHFFLLIARAIVVDYIYSRIDVGTH